MLSLPNHLINQHFTTLHYLVNYTDFKNNVVNNVVIFFAGEHLILDLEKSFFITLILSATLRLIKQKKPAVWTGEIFHISMDKLILTHNK